MDAAPTREKEKEDSPPQNSECDETEPDGDSVWSSRSVSASDGGTDNNSSVGSLLRDLPTVRAKEEGDNEIHKLILAAEALVLERARLKITSNPLPRGSMETLMSNSTDATANTSVAGRTHGAALPDNRCGASNSGYFTDTENTGQASYMSSSLSAEKSMNLDVYGEKDQHSVQSRESLSSTGCDSLILSKVSDSSLKGHGHLQPENVVPAEITPTSIPRLSLEPLRDLECGRATGVSEERVAINKVEKEACNSSIRGSSGGTVRPQKEPQITVSGEDHFNGTLFAGAGGQAASVMVHEEGSCLLNLALSATSSLKRLTRLMRQVGALQLGPDTPRVGESVVQELEQHEAHQQGLETRLTAAATRLQTAVAQVRGQEGLQQEHQREAAVMHRSALALLEQVEAGLESCNLGHMLAVTSPRRRCPARVMEDIGSAVALLVGELSRKTQRITRAEAETGHLRTELQAVREDLTHRDSRARLSEAEAWQVRQQSEEDLTSLRQCLAQAESNLSEAQMENARLSEENKRQTNDSTAALAALQKKLCAMQHKAETRVSELERDLHLSTKEKQRLEATVGEVKDQLTLRTQQVHVVEEENSLLIESLRTALKQQQAEVEQLQQNLETTNTDKTQLSHSLTELKQETAVKEEELQEAREKAALLKRRVTELEEEQRETQNTLQGKVDSLSSERSDLETKVRAQELAMLQLRTELEMEKVQTRALTEEAAAAGKKAKDLQERLWTQARRLRNSSGSSIATTDLGHREQQQQLGTSVTSAYSSCTSLSHPPATPKVANIDKDSLAREERLQSLLREKDVEMRSLHHSLSSQITNKNQELEMLTNKLTGLEEQLCTLVKGLEASAAIGDITSEVGHLLQERTQHLDTLQQSSHWLQEELSSLAMENQTLSTELMASRRSEKDHFGDAQRSVRQARQEAREERVASARLREECSSLQAQLDLAQYSLQQERQERRMTAMVNGVKHQEFSSLLESASAALSDYKP